MPYPRIVESTDARMFGLDDAEVQKRRRYVGYVRTEIRVGSYLSSFNSQCLLTIILYLHLHPLIPHHFSHTKSMSDTFILTLASLEHERSGL